MAWNLSEHPTHFRFFAFVANPHIGHRRFVGRAFRASRTFLDNENARGYFFGGELTGFNPREASLDNSES